MWMHGAHYFNSFNHGHRVGHTFLYEYTGCPSQCICPITYLWMPSDDMDGRRKLWIWIHPSSFAEAYTSLQAAQASLSKGKHCMPWEDQKETHMGIRYHNHGSTGSACRI